MQIPARICKIGRSFDIYTASVDISVLECLPFSGVLYQLLTMFSKYNFKSLFKICNVVLMDSLFIFSEMYMLLCRFSHWSLNLCLVTGHLTAIYIWPIIGTKSCLFIIPRTGNALLTRIITSFIKHCNAIIKKLYSKATSLS